MRILGESIIPAEKSGTAPLPSRFSGIGRKLVLKQLGKLRYGRLQLVEQTGLRSFGRRNLDFPVKAAIAVHDPAFFGKVLFGGSLGAAEAYMDGDWTADSLTDVIRLLVRNESVLAEMEKGWARLLAPFQRFRHWLRMNTHRGSRSNITAHYDLGNDFYKLFLDETLTYSCGYYETSERSLKDASTAKYDRICRKLRITPEDHVLEIGTGWGGFALHAAGRYGCKVTTTTISEEQYRLAQGADTGGGFIRLHKRKAGQGIFSAVIIRPRSGSKRPRWRCSISWLCLQNPSRYPRSARVRRFRRFEPQTPRIPRF